MKQIKPQIALKKYYFTKKRNKLFFLKAKKLFIHSSQKKPTDRDEIKVNNDVKKFCAKLVSEKSNQKYFFAQIEKIY